MKAFGTWLAVTLVGFAGLSGGYHHSLSADPHRVLVVVDSSFDMKADWHRVPALLGRIENQRYAQFALATEKGPVHGYSAQLRSDRLTPYAPRNFSKIESLKGAPLFSGAEKFILVTNASKSEASGLGGWTILRP